MEIRVAKYSMIAMILIMVTLLIWGGHEWGVAKGRLQNAEETIQKVFGRAEDFVPAIPSNCLENEGC